MTLPARYWQAKRELDDAFKAYETPAKETLQESQRKEHELEMALRAMLDVVS